MLIDPGQKYEVEAYGIHLTHPAHQNIPKLETVK